MVVEYIVSIYILVKYFIINIRIRVGITKKILNKYQID